MADVFISYSRKNSDFVHKLDDALTAAGRDVWVDWQDIARGEDWWHSIEVGIDSSDTVLVVVTEHWLLSEVCQRELEYIRKQNKRVFPIIRQKIEGDIALRVKGTWVDQEWEQRARDNWKYLRSLNWLFFDDDTTFEPMLNDLMIALDTDQIYVKSHTRYLVRALEWQQSQRNPSFLLEGDQLSAAKTWLESSTGKHPEPHPNHHDFVTASSAAAQAREAREKAREQLIRRSKQATIGFGVVVVVAVIAAVVVGQQFISARAEVTRAAATLERLNIQVTAAIDQQIAAVALVGTATVEQGRAVEAQQTSAAREFVASTQVAVAGATLSPVAPTLTAVAGAIASAEIQQDLSSRLAYANLQLIEKDNTLALNTANGMVTDYPDEPTAYLGRAIVLDVLGSKDAAIADYTYAIELDPEYTDAYNNRATIYSDQGEFEKALADFTSAIELDPDNDLGYYNRGALYSENGLYEEALVDLNRAIEMNSDYSPSYYARGITYAGLDNYEAAIADYERVIELAPTFSGGYIDRGLAYYNSDDYEAAIEDYTTAIDLESDNAETYYNRALAYYELEEYDLAIEDYTTAIDLEPDNASIYNDRAHAYYTLEEYDLAIEDYTTAIDLEPDYSLLYNNRGYTYALQGEMDAALEDYQQWVQLIQSSKKKINTVAAGETPYTTTLTLTEGLVYNIPFEAAAGQTLTAKAIADNTDTLDTLILLLDPQGDPLTFNDETDKDTNAVISGYTLPTDGTYTLLITHTSSGEEGKATVTLDLGAAAP